MYPLSCLHPFCCFCVAGSVFSCRARCPFCLCCLCVRSLSVAANQKVRARTAEELRLCCYLLQSANAVSATLQLTPSQSASIASDFPRLSLICSFLRRISCVLKRNSAASLSPSASFCCCRMPVDLLCALCLRQLS